MQDTDKPDATPVSGRILTCQIQWIDKDGKPTPDTNPAIGRCWTMARRTLICGRLLDFPESQHFLICAEHAAQISGLPGWTFEPLDGGQ